MRVKRPKNDKSPNLLCMIESKDLFAIWLGKVSMVQALSIGKGVIHGGQMPLCVACQQQMLTPTRLGMHT